jgi:acyl-CoA thioester hydrolase
VAINNIGLSKPPEFRRSSSAAKNWRAHNRLLRRIAMSRLVTYRGVVYPWHCDHMGHMNVMWYTGKFDEASWQLLSSIGLAPSRLRAKGAAMAAVEQHIEYKRELRAGDVITIRSALLEVREKAMRKTHEMINDETGEIAAITVIAVHINAANRKARPLPADVRNMGRPDNRSCNRFAQSALGGGSHVESN